MIIKVDKHSLKVMTQHGEVLTIQPHQITNKRNRKDVVATDAEGNSIQAGDSVVEARGNKRPCTVLHVFRNLVFLHSRENTDNYGVWVEPTRAVVSLVPKENTMTNDIRSPMQDRGSFRGGFEGRGRGRGGPPRGGFMGGRGRGGRDNLLSKTVRITQGPHKGYIGIVKDTTDTMARVELHTNCKVVNVDKAKLVLVDASGNTIGPVVDSRTAPLPRPATEDRFAPADNGYRGLPAQTPRHYGESAMTPRYGASAQTPAWRSSARTPNPYAADGAKTPAWHATARTPNPYASSRSAGSAWDAGNKTPNPYSADRNSKPSSAWDSGSKTPSWSKETPRWSSSGSKTPSHNDLGNRTPAWSRPGDRDTAPTPGVHASDVPATPGVSIANYQHYQE